MRNMFTRSYFLFLLFEVALAILSVASKQDNLYNLLKPACICLPDNGKQGMLFIFKES